MKAVASSARLSICSVLLTAFCLLACSIPNLEDPDCRESRAAVREFYSFHFGNDMNPTEENIRLRGRYLTPLYVESLTDTLKQAPRLSDFFTGSEDFPKAFRVGECKVLEPGKRVQFEVLLFWKDNTRTEQKSIYAGLLKEGDNWLINLVTTTE